MEFDDVTVAVLKCSVNGIVKGIGLEALFHGSSDLGKAAAVMDDCSDLCRSCLKHLHPERYAKNKNETTVNWNVQQVAGCPCAIRIFSTGKLLPANALCVAVCIAFSADNRRKDLGCSHVRLLLSAGNLYIIFHIPVHSEEYLSATKSQLIKLSTYTSMYAGRLS